MASAVRCGFDSVGTASAVTWDEFIAMIVEPATVIVEPYAGDGPDGPMYGVPATYANCFVDATRKEQFSKDGVKVHSATVVYGPLNMTCPVRSRVSIGTQVLVAMHVDTLNAHGLDLPEHVEITCK